MVNSRYGKDLAEVLGPSCCCDKAGKGREKHDPVTINRRANEQDLARYEANKEREAEALQICRQKVEARRLDMKLVSAHYLEDDSKLLFFFTAESRVDFRELVKDLVSVFKTRIELRQIGVRDESEGARRDCGLRAGAVLQRHYRQAQPRIDQDGQRTEPELELDEDLRTLRQTPLLSLLRVRFLSRGEAFFSARGSPASV